MRAAGGGQEDVPATEVDRGLQAVNGALLLSDTWVDDLLDLPTASEDGANSRDKDGIGKHYSFLTPWNRIHVLWILKLKSTFGFLADRDLFKNFIYLFVCFIILN